LELSDEQKEFVPWFINNKSRVCVLTGHAGSGKTTVLGLLDKECKALWCCYTHVAKSVLDSALTRGSAMTVSSALNMRPHTYKGKWIFSPSGSGKINDANIVVVDEASTISAEYLDLILDSNARKILFVGDPEQLPPIDEMESPVFSAGFPTYELTKIYRQEGGKLLDFVTETRTSGRNVAEKWGILRILPSNENITEFYERYGWEGVAVCPTNREKERCNRLARPIFANDPSKLTSKFYSGERLFLESPVGIDGPKNGARVLITGDEPTRTKFMEFDVWKMEVEGQYNIFVPDNDQVVKAVRKQLKSLEKAYKSANIKRREEINTEVTILSTQIIFASHGFAMTIHKSQGSTFKHVLVLTNGMKSFEAGRFRQRMAYTAVTRASKTIVICGDV
jgi:exodeoxyribonuclease-5